MDRDTGFYILIVVFSLLIILFGNISEKYFLRPMGTVLLFPFRHGSDLIDNLTNLYKENKELKQKLSYYVMNNYMLKELKEENIRLKRMLSFKIGYSYDLIPASIIGKLSKAGRDFLLINVGIKNGINVDMPVITEKGLLGKIINVNPIEATIQTIEDANFSIIVKDKRSRATGRLYALYPGPVIMTDFPMYVDIKTGDTLITAGLDDIYPKGIPVGRITEVYPDDNKYFLKSIVFPFFSEGNSEEIFIINKKRKSIEWNNLEEESDYNPINRLQLYDWNLDILYKYRPIKIEKKVSPVMPDTTKIDTLGGQQQ